jgi:catechol 2,3-dioxygenase-like lactoylglutathione lyase family enzyme
MKKPATILVFIVAFHSCFAFTQSQTVERPKILGIDHVSFYTTDPDAVKKLYNSVLGLAEAAPIEPGGGERFLVGSQWVGYSAAADANSTDRMDHVAFATDDLIAMRKFFAAKKIKPSGVQDFLDHSRSFFVTDPEGNRIEFVERASVNRDMPVASAVSRRMIHAGFIVHDRDLEDGFYRDLLGFHLYWQGGMHDDKTDWVAMQVPDGTEWLEYMLNQKEHPDRHTEGVMNHISLGVRDMKQAQAILESHGWKPHGEEHAQMGKDGKWQLNIYDPDQTRIELMEFKPAQKPCCSEFTGTHPSD